MSKAFTLMELLAVIVILAIIALIATPIVLNIINDSKNSADKRSIELYGSAIKNAIANYSLNNSEDSEITLEKIQEYIEYEGNKVECITTKMTKDGVIYLEECKVEGKEVDYTYGDININTPVSFSSDGWGTIIYNIKKGNTSAYNVGDTKEIDLGELGKHTVRIANMSTPEECNTDGFSQTSCGFVIEFEDAIIQNQMNIENSSIGGWRDSTIRTYVNEIIYNSLPNKLKNNIMDTFVVSGHGSGKNETNFETTDKIFLLSLKEIYGEENSDTASQKTRQLDYYKGLGVTKESYKNAIKKNNEKAINWWTRSYSFTSGSISYIVVYAGNIGAYYVSQTNWVSPAFKIG